MGQEDGAEEENDVESTMSSSFPRTSFPENFFHPSPAGEVFTLYEGVLPSASLGQVCQNKGMSK